VQDVNIPEKRIKLAISYCDQHPDEQNRSYCYDCKRVTCHLCFVDNHIDHKWTDINKAAKEFCGQLKDDVNTFSECSQRRQDKLDGLDADVKSFMKKVASTESEISEKYNQLISLIQSHQSQLMEKLNVFKNNVLNEIVSHKDEIERQFVISESFKRYCQEI